VKTKNSLILFIIFFLGLSVWVWLGYQGYRALPNLGEKYAKQAQVETNIKRKNYFFTLAMALNPTDNTRIAYIETLLKNADFNKAESELLKLNDQKARDEYTIYLEASRGNYQNLGKLEAPATELGKLLKAITDTTGGTSNERLSNSKSYIENHNFGLGRYILYRLNEMVALKESYELIAQSFELEKNFSQALNWESQLIAFDPSRVDYYEKAISYAKSANDQISASHLEKQLAELKKSQK
jgi:hypothetical protein